MADSDRFMKYVQKLPNECWQWTGHYGSGPYGAFKMRQRGAWRDIGAHRASYQLFVGPIADGKNVCHKCDNPQCVNPNHLWLGTAKDNVRDMWAKGRANPVNRPSGSKHFRAKMSDGVVPLILKEYASGMLQKQLAEKYGVCQTTISRLVRRLSYREVGGCHC